MTSHCKPQSHPVLALNHLPPSVIEGPLRKENQELFYPSRWVEQLLEKLKQQLKVLVDSKQPSKIGKAKARENVQSVVKGAGRRFLLAQTNHRVIKKASTHVQMMIIAALGRRRWFVLSTAEVAATTQTTTAETTGTDAANQEQRLKSRIKQGRR